VKIESFYGKELERLDVQRIEPKVSAIFSSVEDLKLLFDNMYLLDAEDRDLMLLLFICQKRQEDIGVLFDVTQEAVSYQMKKLRSRIRFIKRLRSVQPQVDEFFEFVVGTSDIPVHFIESAALMFFTTSQTISARILGVNQATVRYRFSSFVDAMKKIAVPKRFRKIAKYVKGLQKYHNRVKRIRRG